MTLYNGNIMRSGAPNGRGGRSLGSEPGWASVHSHHGEILQGVFESREGQVRRALVTLPRLDIRSAAMFEPDDSCAEVTVEPAWKHKARRAAELTLALIDGSGMGGRLLVTDHIPVKYGFGSSTSDVVAAIRAVGSALGRRLSAETVAKLSVQAEVASDSIMFEERTVLFAQREGCILEDFGGPLPPLTVIGFNTDASSQGLSTLELPLHDYTWRDVQQYRPLVGLLRAAIVEQSADYVGRVATASARLNQRFVPKPHFDALERLCERVGAAGLQVAHSGTVAGFIFDANVTEAEARHEVVRRSLAELGIRACWSFRAGDWRDE